MHVVDLARGGWRLRTAGLPRRSLSRIQEARPDAFLALLTDLDGVCAIAESQVAEMLATKSPRAAFYFSKARGLTLATLRPARTRLIQGSVTHEGCNRSGGRTTTRAPPDPIRSRQWGTISQSNSLLLWPRSWRLLDVWKPKSGCGGGWAMDFFLGRITRRHLDVDWFGGARTCLSSSMFSWAVGGLR